MKRSRPNPNSEIPVSFVQKNELNLFANPVEQNVILSTKDVQYGPDYAITKSAPIMFSITADTENFTDLASTYIIVQARVLKADGTLLTDDDTVQSKVKLFFV